MAYHQCYDKMTLNEMALLMDLLYLVGIQEKWAQLANEHPAYSMGRAITEMQNE